MRIHIGYDITFQCPQPTPLILTLNVHYSRVSDLERPDHQHLEPSLPLTSFRDSFGNWCTRLVAPTGSLRVRADAVIGDTGSLEHLPHTGAKVAIQDLPEEALIFLLGSRYCETDLLGEKAWSLFGHISDGAVTVRAICDYVHKTLTFGYQHADPTRGAARALSEGHGVCRDFAHLAITLCRCMNIPARYCTGYLGDIGVPPADAPMDFSAWFEAYVDGTWHTFDARHNCPRIGRVLIGRGRDATDVALSTGFGPHELSQFQVWTDELPEHA